MPGRQQGGSRATRERNYHSREARSRGSQRVSPGGEYLAGAPHTYQPSGYDTDRYTDQGFGENRDHSDWRTEDHLFGGGVGAERGEHGAQGYRGVGPRGYRRSDARIREDVCESLTDNPMIDASNIEVEVKDCEVTLSGTVTSREDKRRAEDVAEAISGVRDVHNRLRIQSDLDEKGETSSAMSEMTETQTARH